MSNYNGRSLDRVTTHFKDLQHMEEQLLYMASTMTRDAMCEHFNCSRKDIRDAFNLVGIKFAQGKSKKGQLNYKRNV
jgi:hypothetical protein